jgi:hypothetical protein
VSDDPRRELAEFLRTRPTRLRPQDVGLEPGPRRRVAGLRREELALLAGVSADYYQRRQLNLDWDAYPMPGAPGPVLIVYTAALGSPDDEGLQLLAGLLGRPGPSATRIGNPDTPARPPLTPRHVANRSRTTTLASPPTRTAPHGRRATPGRHT